MYGPCQSRGCDAPARWKLEQVAPAAGPTLYVCDDCRDYLASRYSDTTRARELTGTNSFSGP